MTLLMTGYRPGTCSARPCVNRQQTTVRSVC